MGKHPHFRRTGPEGAQGRLRSLVITTGTLIGSVALGLGMAQGTMAYFHETKTAPPATIRAGNLDLLVNGKQEHTLAAQTITPAAPMLTSFTLTNNSALPMTVDWYGNANSFNNVGQSSDFYRYVYGWVTPVAPNTTCTASMAGGTKFAIHRGRAALGSLAPQQTQNFCLEVGINPDTPSTFSGSYSSFAAFITGKQSA